MLDMRTWAQVMSGARQLDFVAAENVNQDYRLFLVQAV